MTLTKEQKRAIELFRHSLLAQLNNDADNRYESPERYRVISWCRWIVKSHWTDVTVNEGFWGGLFK